MSPLRRNFRPRTLCPCHTQEHRVVHSSTDQTGVCIVGKAIITSSAIVKPFRNDLNSNRIHLGDESRVCLGAYLPGVRPVFMRREKPGRESVADAEKLCYPTVLKYDCKDQTFSYYNKTNIEVSQLINLSLQTLAKKGY